MTGLFRTDAPNRVFPAYTISTTTATDSVGRIRDRMPMAIAPDSWAEQLDPSTATSTRSAV